MAKKKQFKPSTFDNALITKMVTELPYKEKIKKIEREKTQEDLKKKYTLQQQKLQNWFDAIKTNINKSIENLNYNCSLKNRLKEAEKLKNQLKAIKIIKQVKSGKTILQGFNFNK